MQLNHLKELSTGIKVGITIALIVLVQTVFSLFLLGGEASEGAENPQAEYELAVDSLVANLETQGRGDDQLLLFKGMHDIIDNSSAETISEFNTFFTITTLGNLFTYLGLGLLLIHFLLPKKDQLNFSNRKFIMFWATIMVAIFIPVVAYLVNTLYDSVGFSDLYKSFVGEDSANGFSELGKLYGAVLPNNSRGYFITFIGICLIPAVGEEIMFRGLFLRLFSRGAGSHHNGIAVSALLFALFHFDFPHFLYYFTLGVVMGYVYVWGRNIIFPIIIHVMNNTSVLSLYYGAGALEDDKLEAYLEASRTQSEIGMSSFMGIFTVGLALLVFYLNYRKHQDEQFLVK